MSGNLNLGPAERGGGGGRGFKWLRMSDTASELHPPESLSHECRFFHHTPDQLLHVSFQNSLTVPDFTRLCFVFAPLPLLPTLGVWTFSILATFHLWFAAVDVKANYGNSVCTLFCLISVDLQFGVMRRYNIVLRVSFLPK